MNTHPAMSILAGSDCHNCTRPAIRTKDTKMTRELDGRITDGIHVGVLWNPNDDRISVAVNDTKTEDAFELPVRDGDRVLDVFRHPYAYAT